MKIPPSVFSIGRPEEVLSRDGKVFNPKQKVFIETQSGKVRVQTAVCTHLGCTVNMVETGYACPAMDRPMIGMEEYRGARPLAACLFSRV